MSEVAAWKTLTPGAGPEAKVLTIDFDATGRVEARFADLARNVKTNYGFWESIPPAADPGATAADYVEHWARQIEDQAVPVRAIFGYCAGGVYAAALADRLATEAPVVLFDPELSVAQTLIWQYYKVVGLMTPQLGEAAVEHARERARAAFDRHTDVGALQEELAGLVREVGDPAFASIGLEPARRAELFDVFGSFLRFLALAGQIDPTGRWRSATAFSSATPMSGLRGMRTAGRDIQVAREIEVDVEHAGLLAHPKVAEIVTELL